MIIAPLKCQYERVQTSQKSMNIEQIKSLIAEDMTCVDTLIQTRLASDVVLVNQLSHYIINSGGKRLRPHVSVLASRAGG